MFLCINGGNQNANEKEKQKEKQMAYDFCWSMSSFAKQRLRASNTRWLRMMMRVIYVSVMYNIHKMWDSVAIIL